MLTTDVCDPLRGCVLCLASEYADGHCGLLVMDVFKYDEDCSVQLDLQELNVTAPSSISWHNCLAKKV